MKKKRRKTSKCLNCNLSLEKQFDYCPSCGQENNDNQVSFKSLVVDFFSNYFSLDSRFGRSFKPFFLQPGQLTREFLDGKRVKYANPIRLYLVISLIHFFFFNIHTDNKSEDSKPFIQIQNDDADIAELLNDIPLTADTTTLALDTGSVDSGDWPLTEEEWEIIDAMVNNKEQDYTLAEIEDSIQNHTNTWSDKYVKRQLIKVLRSNDHTLNTQIVQKIPLAMFFVLPVLALFLKILFRRKLYINHLIHSLHLHSFGYIILTVVWVIMLFDVQIEKVIMPVSLILIGLYTVLSFKRTYQIKYAPAVAKSILAGFIYLMLLVVMLLMVVLASLLLY